jgi:hypothetical protein
MSEGLSAVFLMFLLSVKHFVFDFLYQPPRMWMNKGTYGHVGGIEHSGYHSLATMVILFLCIHLFAISPIVILYLGLAEFVIHYHMDWFKMKYNAHKGWGPTTHNQFWILLGVDQLVHMLTYLGITGVIVG